MRVSYSDLFHGILNIIPQVLIPQVLIPQVKESDLIAIYPAR